VAGGAALICGTLVLFFDAEGGDLFDLLLEARAHRVGLAGPERHTGASRAEEIQPAPLIPERDALDGVGVLPGERRDLRNVIGVVRDDLGHAGAIPNRVRPGLGARVDLARDGHEPARLELGALHVNRARAHLLELVLQDHGLVGVETIGAVELGAMHDHRVVNAVDFGGVEALARKPAELARDLVSAEGRQCLVLHEHGGLLRA
jgi:hypothetical protein